MDKFSLLPWLSVVLWAVSSSVRAATTVTTLPLRRPETALTHLDPTQHTFVSFTVNGPTGDIHVILSEDRNPRVNAYTIGISTGRDSNTICLMKDASTECLAEAQYWELLEADVDNTFWMAFNSLTGAVEFGVGATYGEHWQTRLLYYEDATPLGVTTVSVKTRTTAATWVFDTPTEAPVATATVCPTPDAIPSGAPHTWGLLTPTSQDDSELDWFITTPLLLTASSTVNSITITGDGMLVFDDGIDVSITLQARHIIIKDGGQFWIGSEDHPYAGTANIILYGLSTDTSDVKETDAGPIFGRKVIGVGNGGTLELHGQEKLSWTRLTATLLEGGDTITLQDDVSSWMSGDQIVVATTEDDMTQTEEFVLTDCDSCDSYTRRLTGVAAYTHYGEIYEGVDMRAEVGLLSRNIHIRGDMQDACYGQAGQPNLCDLFTDDIFGGHMIFLRGFTNVHLSHIEVTEMGQQDLGRYPIHFHMCDDVDALGCYDNPAYVKSVSVHHCFDRCLTIHGTDGVTVQDMIGYDTLGHCFFLENGGEQRNVFDHNLGMSTKYGTVEPTDRSIDYCTTLDPTANPSGCDALSTFWITHPNNTFTNNAAVGSFGAGFWYIFRDAPSGPSQGRLPPGHIATTPIAEFSNNKAVAHSRAGLMIDWSVNTAPTTDGLEINAILTRSFVYQPTTTANITNFTAVKNRFGSWARGGNIRMSGCRYADNRVGHQFFSDPYLADNGEHLILEDSIFVGKSPINTRGMTVRGVRFQEGPVHLKTTVFRDYPVSTNPSDVTSAIAITGGLDAYRIPFSTLNQVAGLSFVDVDSAGVLQFDATADMAVLQDKDGSLTGSGVSSYVISQSNYLARHSSHCTQLADVSALTCQGSTASIYVEVSNPATGSTLTREDYPDNGVSVAIDPNSQKYNIRLEENYILTWNGGPPNDISIKMINFYQNDAVRVAVNLCLGPGAEVIVTYSTRDTTTVLESATELAGLEAEDTYFWDSTSNLLYVKVKAKVQRDTWWTYPEGVGPEEINISPSTSGSFVAC